MRPRGHATGEAPVTGGAGTKRDVPLRMFRALTRLVRTYQFRDPERVGYHGVTVTQVYAIECLARRGPIRLQDLAGEMGLDKSTTSRLVEQMVRTGLARRADHPSDGRAWQITLGARGRRLYARIERDLLGELTRVMDRFPGADHATMAAFIDRFAEAAASRSVLRNEPRRSQRKTAR